MDLPISALPAATLPLAGAESIALVQGGTTKQAPASAIRRHDQLHIGQFRVKPVASAFHGFLRLGAWNFRRMRDRQFQCRDCAG